MEPLARVHSQALEPLEIARRDRAARLGLDPDQPPCGILKHEIHLGVVVCAVMEGASSGLAPDELLLGL